MSRFKSILYKILVLFLISLSFVDDLSYAVEKKYLIYQVKKHDTIYKILKKYKLLPVFGKGGYLKKTLDLNPAKKKTKGNLIYPRERLRIPLLIKGKKKKHSKKVVNREVEEVKFQAPIISTASIELKAYLDSIDVTLSWDVKDQQQPLTFEVKRSSFSGTEYKIIGQNIAEKEYIDKGLVFNNIYFYTVSGVDNTGNTIISNEVSVVYNPIFYTSLSAKLNEDKIDLKWENYDKKTTAIYDIKRSLEKEGDYRVIAKDLSTTNFTDDDISADKKYYYMVTAKSLTGDIADSNKVEVLSYEGSKIPTSLNFSVGTSYLSYHEYNLQNNMDVVLNSSVSPSLDIKYLQNWRQDLFTYASFGMLYIDLLNSNFYNISNNPNYLFNFHLGIQYDLLKNLYVQNDLYFAQDLLYMPFSNNNSLQKVLTVNDKILGGFYFVKTDSLKVSTELGYIGTLPTGYNPVSLGSGYEVALKINKKFPSFDLGSRLYYLNRNVNTPSIKSNINDFGVIGEFSFLLGVQ